MLATTICALTLTGAGYAPPKQTSPETPEQKYAKELDADREMGRKYSAEYDKEFPPTKDAAALARVKRIGERLALIANANPVDALWGDDRHATFDYTFKVVESPDVNAFSLPGGYIYVFDGLVKFCESDDELAGVLAHEISHAEQRHIATLQREQRKLEKFSIPLILAAILSGGALAPLASGAGLVGTALTSGWSQKAETSADWGGFQYMRRSEYDPTGLLTFMERLRLQEFNQTQGRDLGIYRTHPPSAVRAERIEEEMEAAKIPIRRSRVTTTFRAVAEPSDDDATTTVRFGARPLFTLAGRGASARATEAAEKINVFMDRVPGLYEVRTRPDGTITGANRELVTFTPLDAASSGITVPAMQESATRAIRASLVGLAYHLWEGR